MQGARIGTALLDVAAGHGARELWVYQDNPGARGFYERQGWTLVPDSAEVGEDWVPVAPAVRYRL
jgi:GNAT superfamily N-acetyltransferase